MSKCDDYPINNIDAEDVPTWGKSVLPDEGYLLMAAKEKDAHCGRVLPFLYHLPLGMITPGKTFQSNSYSINGVGFDEEWPTNQVRGAYTYAGERADVRFADITSNKAQYLLAKKDETQRGNYIALGGGFYTFPAGHQYIPGYSYYLGEDGLPTTDDSYVDGHRQHLFEAVDTMTILINIYTENE